jgi:branched-chain amino acid transport system ATP-binding protein
MVVEEVFAILRTLNRDEGVSMLLVEQNAILALDLADQAYLLETGQLVLHGPSRDMREDDGIRRSYLGY